MTDVLNIEKRREAMNLLEEIRGDYAVYSDLPRSKRPTKANAKFMAMANRLYALLIEHFPPTVTPSLTEDDMIVEIHYIVRNGFLFEDESVWMECSNAAFVTMIIRRALNGYKLPICIASEWRKCAQLYSHLVMAA